MQRHASQLTEALLSSIEGVLSVEYRLSSAGPGRVRLVRTQQGWISKDTAELH